MSIHCAIFSLRLSFPIDSNLTYELQIYLFMQATQTYLPEQLNDSVLKSYLIILWVLSLMGQLPRHKFVSNQWSIPPFLIVWLIENPALVTNGQPCLFILDDHRLWETLGDSVVPKANAITRVIASTSVDEGVGLIPNCLLCFAGDQRSERLRVGL